MSRRAPFTLAIALLTAFAAGAHAQDTADTAADALAAKATADVVAAYHARADALAAQKQFGRALQLRRELIQEWAPGDARALKALGFVDVGSTWRRDANIVVFDRDQKGDAKVLKKLDQDWTRTQKELIKGVEQAAQALTAAGVADRALVFWRRLLRLKPGDARATAALRLPTFDGVAGTPDELRIVRRGRAITQAVAFLKQWEPRLAPIEREHPVLKKAGLACGCVQSDHFTVFGTIPPDKLLLAARFAERALLLSRVLFGTAGGAVFEPRLVRNIVCCGDKGSYHRVLDTCADQFGKERLAFLKEYVELAFVDVDGDVQRVYALTKGGDDLLVDVISRGVVQDAAGFKSDGLWEGLGHATCGFLFDRTLSFFVEQQHGRTVTAWQPKPLLPDMASWRDIATESAWAKNDTPTAQLVLLDGAKFSNEERVKAWSMADYLLRDRPELLLQLDAIRTPEVKDPLAVEAAFRAAAGVDLRELDARWRDYWGKGEALRSAMAAAPAGVAADVDAARPVSWAIDAARAQADVAPAGFVLADSADCKTAFDWVDQMAKWENDRKDPKRKDLPPPSPPVSLGATVLLQQDGDAVAAVAAWMAQPVVRDFLLHPGRDILAVTVRKQGIALDLTVPLSAVERGLPQPWPRPGQSGVPGQVAVKALGPAVVAALAAAGVGADETVGMPVTLHFRRELAAEFAREVACRLRVGGLERPGVLVPLQDVEGLRAPGCFAFVPRAPLPAGEVEVQWTLPKSMLKKNEVFPRVSFTAQ